MKVISSFLAFLVIIVVLAGAGYGIWQGHRLVYAQWTLLDINWKACLIIITTVLILCALFLSVSIRAVIKKHVLTSAGKVIAYNEFITWYAELKNNNQEIRNPNSFKKTKNQIMVWGNNYVVKQTNLLYELLKNDSINPDQILKKADHVYLEIKRDLGHSSFRVDRSIM